MRGAWIIALILISLSLGSNAQSVGNSGFEQPVLGTNPFVYDPATGPSQEWIFQLDSGIARSDPNFFEASDPTDGQFAFLQGNNETNGIISQTISFPTTGLFQLSYLEAGRLANGQGAFGDLSYNLSITLAGTGTASLDVNDSTTSGQPFMLTTYSFNIPVAGDYVLSFTALNAPHNDDTAFLMTSPSTPCRNFL